MSETVLGPTVRAYLDEVAASLRDLDPTERGELLDEVREHLVSVGGEIGSVELRRDALVARLGPPSSYAAELRSAAGLGFASDRRNAEVGNESLWQAALRIRGVAATWAYLRRLEPAWWAVRGYLIAGTLIPWLVAVPATGASGTNLFLHWHVDGIGYYGEGNRLGWGVPVVVLVVVSAIVGVRAEHGRSGRRLLSRILDLAGVIGLVLMPTWWIGPTFYAYVLQS